MKTFDEIILNNELSNVAEVAERVYRKRHNGSSLTAYKLEAAVLNLIFDNKFSEEELSEIITDSTDDEDIDAIYLERRTLNLFDFKEKLSATKIEQEISAFNESIESYVFNKPANFSSIKNLILKKQLKRFHKNRKNIETIKIYIYLGMFLTPSLRLLRILEIK